MSRSAADGYEHAIDIPGHGRLTSVFSDTRAERGEHVGLRLDPRGCHLFSAGPEGAARPASAGRHPAPTPPGHERRRSLLDGHVWNGAGHVRNWPSRLVTVSHLGSDHA